jgi:PAS domain S-box-containing protein
MESSELNETLDRVGARLEALAERERRLRRMVDSIPGLVSYVDRHRRYVFVNRMYETWFGRARRDVIGKTTDEVLGPQLMAHARPQIERALRGEEVRFEHESPYADGPRWVSGAYIPDFDESGEVAGFSVFVVDNTKRKLAEEALRESEARHREANHALQAADRRKDEFLATISHELRNPLAAIRNAVAVLTAPPDPKTQWVSEMVGRQLQHVSRLLEDLLDVSRVAHDKLALRIERVDLADVVSAAVEVCRPSLEAAGHQLALGIPPRTFLMADVVRLSQVFSNLIGNAIKYTAPGGHIDIIGETRGNEIVVSVKDDGIGISAELLPRVFELFAQGERAFDRGEGGLGLGLSLVRGLLELHGGHVEAHSDGPGKGSEFVVHLPGLPEGTPKAAVSTPSGRLRVGVRSRNRVIVADDLRDITDSLAIVMRRVGFEVHTAYDGREALARVGELRPHVVILDIGMPKVDGYEAARQIRAEPWGQEMTLIALTGWGGKTVQKRTDEAGFDHHLVKPIEPSALLELLASLEA